MSKPRGRPRRTQTPRTFSVKLVLYPGEDDDLIVYLDAAPARKRAAAIKTAMRSGNIDAATLDDLPDDEILDAFEDLLV